MLSLSFCHIHLLNVKRTDSVHSWGEKTMNDKTRRPYSTNTVHYAESHMSGARGNPSWVGATERLYVQPSVYSLTYGHSCSHVSQWLRFARKSCEKCIFTDLLDDSNDTAFCDICTTCTVLARGRNQYPSGTQYKCMIHANDPTPFLMKNSNNPRSETPKCKTINFHKVLHLGVLLSHWEWSSSLGSECSMLGSL